jgi:hypothetical protein
MEQGEENAEITLRPLFWMGDSLDKDAIEREKQ